MKKIMLITLGLLAACLSFAESVVAPISQPQYYIISPYNETASSKSEVVKESFGDISADSVWSILNNVAPAAKRTDQKFIQPELSEIKKQSMEAVQGQLVDRPVDGLGEVVQKSLPTTQKTVIDSVKKSYIKPVVVYDILPSGVMVERKLAVESLDVQSLELNDQQDAQSPILEMQNMENQKKPQAVDDE